MIKNSLYKLAAFTILAIFLTIHFTATILYNLPLNPIKTISNIPKAYIDKFFYQDWGMFAPEPVASDISVLISCIKSNSLTRTKFLDIMKDSVKQHHYNRFDPLERAMRVPSNFAFSYLTQSRENEQRREQCKKNRESKSCVEFKKSDKLRKNLAEEGLVRVASYFCADISNRSKIPYDNAEIKISISPVNRWSSRFSPHRTTQIISLGQYKINSVKGNGLWR